MLLAYVVYAYNLEFIFFGGGGGKGEDRYPGNMHTRGERTKVMYSVFLWSPPVAFCYPEIKATEVKALKLKMLPLQLLFQDI